MHLSTKRRVVLGFSTGGLLVGGLGMGIAQADAAASGGAAGSPGLLSGNLVQVPINAPVNVCGNSISVIGILDSAAGNTCANSGSDGAAANGGAKDSPGVGSGNLIQIPINAPVNLCGNSASGVGVGDSAVDNKCSNGSPSGAGAGSGSGANGGSHDSPGVGSGNTVQLPVNAPVNVCGNSASVIGILDTAADNGCSNGGSGGGSTPTPPPCGCHPTPPGTPPPPPGTPPSTPPTTTTPPPNGGRPHSPFPPHHLTPGGTTAHTGSLAETGTGAGNLATPLGAGVLGGTGLLLRKRVSALHHLVGSRKN